MCTLIVKPGRTLTLMGVRDEFTDRPWEAPGEHWPEHPGVVGGRDLKAGGTWLA
ncbi:NRDE family protein, partial [Nonomuraea sp. NPDC003201]